MPPNVVNDPVDNDDASVVPEIIILLNVPDDEIEIMFELIKLHDIVLRTFNDSPILTDLAIPTPPDTTIAPDDIVLDIVLFDDIMRPTIFKSESRLIFPSILRLLSILTVLNDCVRETLFDRVRVVNISHGQFDLTDVIYNSIKN